MAGRGCQNFKSLALFLNIRRLGLSKGAVHFCSLSVFIDTPNEATKCGMVTGLDWFSALKIGTPVYFQDATGRWSKGYLEDKFVDRGCSAIRTQSGEVLVLPVREDRPNVLPRWTDRDDNLDNAALTIASVMTWIDSQQSQTEKGV